MEAIGSQEEKETEKVLKMFLNTNYKSGPEWV